MKSFTLPAGRYYVGCPLYLMTHDQYDRLLHNTNFFGVRDDPNDWGGVFIDSETGLAFGVIPTASFYNGYKSNIYREFMSDDGSFAIIPEMMLVEDRVDGFYFFQTRKPIHCYNDNGTLVFGELKIYTAVEE